MVDYGHLLYLHLGAAVAKICDSEGEDRVGGKYAPQSDWHARL